MLLTDKDTLLRAVLECPFDDASRLVLADALEESGGEDEAAFARTIRAGYELHYKASSIRSDIDEYTCRYLRSMVKSACTSNKEWNRFRWNASLWSSSRFEPCVIGQDPPGIAIQQQESFNSLKEVARNFGVIDRGFISELHCDKHYLWHYGKEIFARNPVTKVVVTDFSPNYYPGLNLYDAEIYLMNEFNAGFQLSQSVYLPYHDRRGLVGCIDAKTPEKLSQNLSDYIVRFFRTANGLPAGW